jgi:hypothetical protein
MHSQCIATADVARQCGECFPPCLRIVLTMQIQLWRGLHSGALYELYLDASQTELKLRLVRRCTWTTSMHFGSCNCSCTCYGHDIVYLAVASCGPTCFAVVQLQLNTL